MASVVAFAFKQMHINQGIRKFGEQGIQAGYKEMKQLHERAAVIPINVEMLSDKEKEQIIDSLLLIEEKRDGSVKGHTVAHGDQQKKHLEKDEVHSPMVNNNSVFLTAVIEAKEGCNVRVHNVPNTFVQTDNDEKVVMKVKGKAAELLVRTDPKLYRKFVLYERGVVVLHVELAKALYGQLKAALLFYKKFVRDLQGIGFKLNPYHPCVANRTINGSQHTVCWHVDDIKSSHVDKTVQDDFEAWMIKTYDQDKKGKVVGKLKKSTGKVLSYLGMELDYSKKGEVSIGMTEYVKKMVGDFEDYEKLSKKVATPAENNLFEVHDDVEKLSEKQSMVFHNAVAKSLYLCKRSQPDIQTVVAFLTTRVKGPDKDDWKKLVRMMAYLKFTDGLRLTLRADNLEIITWWFDAAFSVHEDMKGHSGGSMTLGKGSIMSRSTKQKLNTSSSTEAELVGTYDGMLEVIWANYFLEAQGYNATNMVVYQDNKSTILLAKNGKMSSSKRTKHINVQYYFIQDRWKKGEIDVKYCPTNIMVADFLQNRCRGRSFFSSETKSWGSRNSHERMRRSCTGVCWKRWKNFFYYIFGEFK